MTTSRKRWLELDDETQQFLMRTSILQVVTPALASLVAEVGESTVSELIERAQRTGLLSRLGARSSRRYASHRLVREFLETRLRRELGAHVADALHRRVAEYAETQDWRLSAHHYYAINALPEARRVLADAVPDIMASGEFEIAELFIQRVSRDGEVPALGIVLSRIDLDRGAPDSAVARARSAHEHLSASKSPLEELALENLLAVQVSSRPFRMRPTQNAMQLARSTVNKTLGMIARATALLLDVSVASPIDEFEDFLLAMETEQRANGRTTTWR